MECPNCGHKWRAYERGPRIHLREQTFHGDEGRLCNIWQEWPAQFLTDDIENVSCEQCIRSMESKDKAWRADKGQLA